MPKRTAQDVQRCVCGHTKDQHVRGKTVCMAAIYVWPYACWCNEFEKAGTSVPVCQRKGGVSEENRE